MVGVVADSAPISWPSERIIEQNPSLAGYGTRTDADHPAAVCNVPKKKKQKALSKNMIIT
jgi:hypothetical protein